MISNTEFAKRVGIHFTTASRLRNGKRRPSVHVLRRIAQEFAIPEVELTQAHDLGAAAIGKLLRRRIFE